MPFIFNNDQALVIEFGDLYCRFHLDGAPILEPTKTITGITKANPAVVTSAGHGYSNGDWVYISGVVGMTEVNGRYAKVANKAANTYELHDTAGSNINSTAYTTYASGGTSARVYEITSAYTEAELMDLQFSQNADVITIAHKSHAPAELLRTSNTSWALTNISFASSQTGPDDGSATAATGATNSRTYRYKITGIVIDTLEESLPGTEDARILSSATSANPVVFTTTAAHGYEDGDIVTFPKTYFVNNTTTVHGDYTITKLSATTFSIPVNSTGFGGLDTFPPNQSCYRQTVTRHGAPPRSGLAPQNPVTITWSHTAQYKEYNVYSEDNGVFGFLGVAAPLAGSSTVTFLDIGVTPDYNDTIAEDRDIFNDTDKYPGVVGFFQQRRNFASTNDEPENAWLSKTGFYKRFTYHSPLADDDSIQFTIAGRQVNEVRHLLDLGNLVVLTSGGEWACLGDANGILTPSGINPKQYAYHGAATIPPIIIGNNALYVQARGSIIRDLAFDFSIDGYKGNDLTEFSSHLFESFTITDWAFQQVPNSIVWAVRDDGILLGLTYVKDQDILGWHRHDLGGTVENVCVIPEDNEDVLYVVVKRTINGLTKRYIERMNSRFVSEETISDAIFMDSALTYDGRNAGSTTMTISGGTTWDRHETLTVTSSTSYFLTTDVGKEIHFTDTNGLLFRFSIAARSSATVVTGTVDRLVPVASRSVATTSWTKATNRVTGLFHLEGEQVSVIGDGFVEASPYNDQYSTVTVTAGVANLSKCYGVIHVGLPYFSDLETLDIDSPQTETMADKFKYVGKVTAHVEKTRGMWVGPKPPSDDETDALENLTEAKITDSTDYDNSKPLKTGTITVAILPEWNSNGRIFIRQVDPLPISVLAIAPAGLFPMRGQ